MMRLDFWNKFLSFCIECYHRRTRHVITGHHWVRSLLLLGILLMILLLLLHLMMIISWIYLHWISCIWINHRISVRTRRSSMRSTVISLVRRWPLLRMIHHHLWRRSPFLLLLRWSTVTVWITPGGIGWLLLLLILCWGRTTR